ncbi:MAG: DDE-type integrase/transposase/recombinase [Litorimonas sp.]
MPRPKKLPDPFGCFNSWPEAIRLVMMMYMRFPLGLRNVEDLLADCRIDICQETVRHWWNRFGPMFAADIKRQRISRMQGFRNWRWHVDEVFVKINGETHCLWRTVDHEGHILDSYITRTREQFTVLRLFKKALNLHGKAETMVAEGRKSYLAAMREIGNSDCQGMGRWKTIERKIRTFFSDDERGP